MKKFITLLALPAIIGFTIVLPFIILEIINRRDLPDEFPYVLFATMFALAFLFMILLKPVVSIFKSGLNKKVNTLGLLLRFSFLIAIALFWIGLLIDQMPCFLGVANCD